MFPHLLSLGYEGALATFELLVRSDRSCAWPATIGLESFAVAAGGLPIIPRIRAHPSWKNDVVLAAFLRQPIAVAVHHQDAAQEMAPLAEIARTVNSVGNIVWSDLPGTLRTSYVQKIAGDVLHVRMYSSAVTVRMPDGARRICVHRPWIAEGHTERIRIRLVHGSEIEEDVGAVSRPVSLLESEVVEVRSEARAPLDLSSVAPSGVHLWPIARKAMMELRDRVTPVLSRFGFGWESTRTAQR
jgi:hypothetical protein